MSQLANCNKGTSNSSNNSTIQLVTIRGVLKIMGPFWL